VDLNLEARLFAGWLPIRLFWQGHQPAVDWCFLGQTRFREPFFDQTISRVVQRPFNLLFRHQTPIDWVGEINATLPGLTPTGFIFHMSRCRSTLVAQMLAALGRCLVISEAPLFDFVFRDHAQAGPISDEQRVQWLRWVIGALGQRRDSQHQHFFIKFDSWHVLHLKLIRQAFPEVPWIFLFREPLEILASHQRQPAAQMYPGLIPPRLLGLTWSELAGMPADEYCARVLAAICQAALAQPTEGQARFINYAELPGAVQKVLVPFFKMNCSPDELRALHRAAEWDAKEPSVRFSAEQAVKSREPSERLNPLAAQWLETSFQQLKSRSSNK
jgi:hypothetical protein